MSATEITTISAVVMTLTQILKRALPRDDLGIYLAGGVSLVVVLIYVGSAAQFPPARTDIWALFSGWVAVFSGAAGLHSISGVATSTVDIQRKRLRARRVARLQGAVLKEAA